MASQAQLDSILVVGFAAPSKSAGPIDGSGAIPVSQAAYFSSIQALDQALGDDMGIPEIDLQSMTVNDKIFAARTYLEDGNTFTSLGTPLPSADVNASAPTSEVRAWGTVWIDTANNDVYQTSGGGSWTLIHDFA